MAASASGAAPLGAEPGPKGVADSSPEPVGSGGGASLARGAFGGCEGGVGADEDGAVEGASGFLIAEMLEGPYGSMGV